jgi:hypothetical protein
MLAECEIDGGRSVVMGRVMVEQAVLVFKKKICKPWRMMQPARSTPRSEQHQLVRRFPLLRRHWARRCHQDDSPCNLCRH